MAPAIHRRRASFDVLLGRIYGAARDPDAWPDVLTALADHLGGIGALLTRHGDTPRQTWALQGGLDPERRDLYLRHYLDNPYSRALRRLPAGATVQMGALVPAKVVGQTAFHADILAPQGIVDHVVLLHAAWQRDGTGGVAVMLPGRAAAGAEALRRLRRLAGHVTRAIDLAAAFAAAEATGAGFTATLVALRQGVVLLDAAGRMTFTNPAAEAMTSAGDGLSFARDGLRAALPAEERALARLVAAAAATSRGEATSPGGTVAISRPSGRPSYQVLVAPLPRPHPLAADAAPAVMLLIADPAAAFGTDLAGRFGLSPAEARVAALVAAGTGIPGAAAQLGLSRETVRTHLARCFAKTETHSQVQLARLADALLPLPGGGRDP